MAKNEISVKDLDIHNHLVDCLQRITQYAVKECSMYKDKQGILNIINDTADKIVDSRRS